MKFQKQNKLWLMILISGIVLGMIGVAFLSSYKPQTQTDVPEGILSGLPCAPPCWQGLTPGDIIEPKELAAFLEEFPSISNYKIGEFGVSWVWQWEQAKNAYPNSIGLDEQVITRISLTINKKLTIDQVLSKYSPPYAIDVALAGLPEKSYVKLRLIYPLQGMTLVVYLPQKNPQLRPETEIKEVVYVAPFDSYQDWKDAQTDVIPFFEWPGYGSICGQLQESGFTCP
jgi:hypothetical protein